MDGRDVRGLSLFLSDVGLGPLKWGKWCGSADFSFQINHYNDGIMAVSTDFKS
jgi:hypothetical protein